MRKLNIVVEYCECGCHAVDIRCGDIYYSYYDDLRGSVRLTRGGCGRGALVKEFKYPQACRADGRKAQQAAIRLGKKFLKETVRSRMDTFFVPVKKRKKVSK